MEINKAAVIGAGVMGHGIALVFAQSGVDVTLVDVGDEILERARMQTIAELRMLIEEGLVAESEEQILARIRFRTDLESSVADVDYVAEAILENLDLKKEVFKKLDRHCADRTILTSNTSFLPIRELAAVTQRPDRVLGAHHVNPPHIVPLVELVPTNQTSQQSLQATQDLLKACGKVPVVLKPGVHGFMPRLLAVLQNEAIRCLEEGLASAEDIDKMVSCSFGFRLPTLGPLRSLDYWSLDIFKAASDHLVKEYNSERYGSPNLVGQMVEEGRVGMMAGKGFYDYSGVDLAELRRQRDRKYCKQLKMLKEAGAI